MTKILLALTLITAPVAQAACTVYGDGFVTPDYILPGNDKADTVSALLGTTGTKDISHVTVDASPMPEPKRSALLAGGLLAVLPRCKRSKKKTIKYNAQTH